MSGQRSIRSCTGVGVAMEKDQRHAGSIWETETMQHLNKESQISRSVNYNSGVTTKGQEDSRNTTGLGEGRRNLSGEPLPKVHNSLKKVCLQPKGRQCFLVPLQS